MQYVRTFIQFACIFTKHVRISVKHVPMFMQHVPMFVLHVYIFVQHVMQDVIFIKHAYIKDLYIYSIFSYFNITYSNSCATCFYYLSKAYAVTSQCKIAYMVENIVFTGKNTILFSLPWFSAFYLNEKFTFHLLLCYLYFPQQVNINTTLKPKHFWYHFVMHPKVLWRL